MSAHLIACCSNKRRACCCLGSAEQRQPCQHRAVLTAPLHVSLPAPPHVSLPASPHMSLPAPPHISCIDSLAGTIDSLAGTPKPLAGRHIWQARQGAVLGVPTSRQIYRLRGEHEILLTLCNEPQPPPLPPPPPKKKKVVPFAISAPCRLDASLHVPGC